MTHNSIVEREVQYAEDCRGVGVLFGSDLK